MVKIKTRIRDSYLYVTVNVPLGIEINNNEYRHFSESQTRFFKLKSMRRLCFKYVFEYSGPNSVSLRERLEMPVSKHDFFMIVAEILDAAIGLERGGWNLERVCWSLNDVYYHDNSESVKLIYLPFDNGNSESDVLELLKQIAYNIKSDGGKKPAFVADFCRMIDRLYRFDSDRLIDYIKKAAFEEYEMVFDPDQITPLYESNTDQTKVEDDDSDGETETEVEQSDFSTEGNNTYRNERTKKEKYPMLRRESTGETVEINKNVFQIGRDNSSDFRITNNRAVSGIHAIIKTRIKNGDKIYTIWDNASTNHTFINGREIIPKRDEIIKDKYKIRLGKTETLVFMIDDDEDEQTALEPDYTED